MTGVWFLDALVWFVGVCVAIVVVLGVAMWVTR